MNISLSAVKLRGVLKHAERSVSWRPEGLAGRWLVIASSGECLLDYVQGACDAERELPVTQLCSLAVALQQFMETAVHEDGPATGRTTHAVVFDTCLLAIAAGHIFSVLAVVSLPQVANPEAPTVPSSAALRFKAAEIHVALSTGELGEEIKKLATHSAESRGEKVSDYTLSSCLTEEAAALRLPLEMASPMQEAFAGALRNGYDTLLAEAHAKLSDGDRQKVSRLCIFDARMEFLAFLSRDEDSMEKFDTRWKQMQLLQCAAKSLIQAGPGAAGAAGASSGAKGPEIVEKSTSLWAWQTVPRCLEVAVLCSFAFPVFVGAMVELNLAEGCFSMDPTSAGSLLHRVLPEEVEMHQRTATIGGVLDSLAKQLCGAMGLQYHSAKPRVVVEAKPNSSD
ncbi:unnamed protein product [Durusdinium trenchii]|uniref:Uncharacterized protein n=1 Tax=Durusdinium trenchii TaxID=1381693 RepID=A0ABP0K6N6_9DINO